MNNTFNKRFGVLLTSVLLMSSSAFSQIDNVDFLRSGPADGVKIIQAYIGPWVNAFGAGLNGSWYNTAKPHKFGGFDITTGMNVGIVPSAAETFDISTIGLSSSISGTGSASTIAGPDKIGPTMTYKNGNVTLASFQTPPGTAWGYIPVPTAQIGIGLPLGTEIKGRFIPKIRIKDGDISLWGVGLMHSVMQYIPGNKLIPVDVSIFAGYTKLQGNIPLNLKPDPSITSHYTQAYPSTAFDDQNLALSIEALNVSAIASLDLKVITFYGGLGYCKNNTEMDFSGNFPTPVLVQPATSAPYVDYNDSGVKKGKDFVIADMEDFSGLRANIGFRIKLAVITIHADYTKAHYNVASAGLGISFR
jgi:hypothetical protein